MDGTEVLRVLAALDGSGIRTGITGGWGIDALVGRQRRAHRDVDLGIAARDVDAAIAVLGTLGYSVVLDQRPARLELHGRAGRVDLHPIVWDETGRGIQTGFDGETFEYPPGSLDADGSIAGQPVRCGTPELQVTFHLGYQPTDTDREDVVALVSAFDLVLPAPYSPARRLDPASGPTREGRGTPPPVDPPLGRS